MKGRIRRRPTPGEPVVVVGGGHNGLICAAYLARAGFETELIEARATVGGCASTEVDLGARFNICHCDHTMIRAVPVIDELELGDHGLVYLEPDATTVNLFHDGSEPWVQFHSADATLEGLAASYPDQVAGYRRYLSDALPVARLVIDAAATVPGSVPLTRTALGVGSSGGHEPSRRGRARAAAAARLVAWGRSSASEVLGRYFDDWRLQLPAASIGPTVWGLPPDLPGTGLAALGYAVRHLVRTGRPQGGSGALTDAVRARFEAAGGRVRCGARIDRLLVADGQVAGVRLTDGTELASSAVVAACDPRQVLVEWLPDPPPAARRLARRYRQRPAADGYESKLDAVLTAAPRFAQLDHLEARFPGVDLLGPTAVVNPSPDDLADAHRLRPQGRVAARPTLLVNAPSVLDPTMAPAPGHHVLSLETLFTPYALEGGWEGSDEPRRWLELWAGMAEPGFLDSVDRWRAMTPDRYERELSMHRGHTPAYGGSPLATVVGRQRELSRYRTPIEGLYLTGAATYPGAGISGAPGRNAAHIVLADLRRSPRRPVRFTR